MTVQQQQPRFSRADQESVHALLQDYIVSAAEEEDNERPFVAADTKARRNTI
ncbi:hypothetical protein C8A03DRAFT_39652 [Achaetomium macrosporum]|uniref:Uncharacterized protein n=1 Tax=Achaetomium macrosporum TaxID=79813 RepID=A0AAN7C0D4_9PEZI|nr:hypothetical protein C8A03DRAFT_39652 [Achaetomium macrosporum]